MKEKHNSLLAGCEDYYAERVDDAVITYGRSEIAALLLKVIHRLHAKHHALMAHGVSTVPADVAMI